MSEKKRGRGRPPGSKKKTSGVSTEIKKEIKPEKSQAPELEGKRLKKITVIHEYESA